MNETTTLECREYGKPPLSLEAEHLLPREKLLGRGPSALSDSELIAIMLGTGRRGKSVITLADDVLSSIDTLEAGEDPSRLSAINGVGKAKTCVLAAALEFGRRRYHPSDLKVTCPGDAWRMISHYADRKQERFIVISLNGAHETIAVRVVSLGLVNRTVVHPREIFADPLVDRAAGILVGHNHPSGKLDPSSEDREITKKIWDSGNILGIPLLDHIIFSSSGFWSFMEHGGIT